MPISPNSAEKNGGNIITITGVNLSNAAVNFDNIPATVTANTPTSVTVLSPPGTGVSVVTVVTPGGISNGLYFYYIEFPIISNINNNNASGPTAGGNTVIINGYNLSTATSVNFGGNAATPTIISDAQISVVAPAAESQGTVFVSIVTAGGTTAEINYNYVDAPTLNNISPASGSTAGGTSVTLTGINLSTTTSITIAGTSAAFAIINSTIATIITPPGTVGAADIVLVTTGGSTSVIGGYTYVSSPGI